MFSIDSIHPEVMLCLIRRGILALPRMPGAAPEVGVGNGCPAQVLRML